MSSPGGLRDPKSWNMATSLPLMRSLVYGEELAAIAEERDDVVLLTADLRTSNRTGDFAERHPDRFYDFGIAEQNMISAAAGMASCGLLPYVSTFASFAGLLCAEHLRTDLAYTGMPVRVLAHHAGISFGFYGTSHDATEDVAITRAIAGMTVISPCDALSIRAALRATVDHDGPIYFRLGRGREPDVYAQAPEIRHGRFVRAREGRDVTIIATGIGVAPSLGAAEALTVEGVDAGVLDAVYLKPIDVQAIRDAAHASAAILTVEDHNVLGGLGGAVAEVLAEDCSPVRFARHGIRDEYAPIAPPTHLWRHYGLDADGIADRVRKLLS